MHNIYTVQIVQKSCKLYQVHDYRTYKINNFDKGILSLSGIPKHPFHASVEMILSNIYTL